MLELPTGNFIAGGGDGIERVEDGIYYYRIAGHALTRNHKGDVSLELVRTALGTVSIYEAR